MTLELRGASLRIGGETLIHPTVFTREGPQMSGLMFLTFCVSWIAVTLLAYVLYRVELLGKTR